jgi:hypothetical protein
MKRTGQHREFERRLDNHFQACSACAGVISLAVSSASAGIVYSGPQNIAVPFTGPGLSIDLDAGAFSGTVEVSGFDIFFTETGIPGKAALRFSGGDAAADGAFATITTTKHKDSSSSSSSSTTTTSVNKLRAGKLITGLDTFAHTGFLGSVSSTDVVGTGPWGVGKTGYVGFQFVSAANTTLYGWARLAVGEGLQTTVVDWAYDDSGQPIVAGLTQETTVRIAAPQPTATAGGAPGAFKFVRKGDLTVPLKVIYSVDSRSTAVSGADYEALRGSVVIPAGKKSVLVPVNALSNPANGSRRKLRVNLEPGNGFDVGASHATVFIAGGQ